MIQNQFLNFFLEDRVILKRERISERLQFGMSTNKEVERFNFFYDIKVATLSAKNKIILLRWQKLVVEPSCLDQVSKLRKQKRILE